MPCNYKYGPRRKREEEKGVGGKRGTAFFHILRHVVQSITTIRLCTALHYLKTNDRDWEIKCKSRRNPPVIRFPPPFTFFFLFFFFFFLFPLSSGVLTKVAFLLLPLPFSFPHRCLWAHMHVGEVLAASVSPIVLATGKF